MIERRIGKGKGFIIFILVNERICGNHSIPGVTGIRVRTCFMIISELPRKEEFLLQ